MDDPRVIPAQSSPLAWEVLAPAAGDPHTLADIRREVAEGYAELWQVRGTEKPAFVVTRVEAHRDGQKELVLVLGAGQGARIVADWATELADHHGMTLRTHITRAGLERIYTERGWHRQEIIMRRNPHGRQ